MFIPSPVDGWVILSFWWVCLFVCISISAINIYLQVFISTCFYSFWENTRNRMIGSYGIFSTLRNCQSLFKYVVQLLNHVWLFATPWTAASQASLSIINSLACSNSCPLSRWCHPTISFSVVPFPCLLSFLVSGPFLMSRLFASGGQSTGASASASVLPMNIQEWFPLGLTGLISLQPKGLSIVFFNIAVQKQQFFGAQPSLWSNSHIHTWPLEKNIALTRWTFVGKVMSLLFNMLSRFVLAFLPRSKRLLMSWLQSPSAVILEPISCDFYCSCPVLRFH